MSKGSEKILDPGRVSVLETRALRKFWILVVFQYLSKGSEKILDPGRVSVLEQGFRENLESW